MSRFTVVEGTLRVDKIDGAIATDEVMPFAMMEALELLQSIDDRLRGIEFALNEGELKVHRTQ